MKELAKAWKKQAEKWGEVSGRTGDTYAAEKSNERWACAEELEMFVRDTRLRAEPPTKAEIKKAAELGLRFSAAHNGPYHQRRQLRPTVTGILFAGVAVARLSNWKQWRLEDDKGNHKPWSALNE